MTPPAPEPQHERVWRAAFDALQEAIWVIDAQTCHILFANLSAARMVGLERADFVGLPVLQWAVTPEDQVFWSDTPEALAQGIHSFSSVLRADGALVPVERRVVPFELLEPGAALLVTMLDCSAQQSTERALESLLSQLRATLDSAADGMLVCGLDGSVRAFNQRLAHIWNMPQELLVQRNDDAVHAFMAAGVVDLRRYQDRLSALASSPETHSRDVFTLHSGEVLERRSVPQLHHGSVMGRVYSFRDITQEMQAQAGLRLAAKVFDSSPDAIFIADHDQRLLRISTVRG